MSQLVGAIQNQARTLNDARSYSSTQSAALDFFSKAGAMRAWSKPRIVEQFEDAIDEDELLALRALFWARDVRGGAGERDTFRTCLEWLAYRHPEYVRTNLDLVPFYGRWDDILVLLDTPLERDIIDLIENQLESDFAAADSGDRVSLLAKWLPSENTSSSETVAMAKAVRRSLGMSPRQYRKTLSRLRKQIGIVERKMSANEWEEIEFGQVPSRAHSIYRNAFREHQPERYGDYLDRVESGDEEIKAGVLYPYELVRAYVHQWGSEPELDRTTEAQWVALPNYLEGSENKNMMVVADTSGSMYSGGDPLPILVSVSLAMYTAERNKGPLNGYWMNFSQSPSLQKVRGDTLRDKITNIDYSNWGSNTDLQAVFHLILGSARMHNVDPDEMPRVVVIISDMQFDRCVNDVTNRQVMIDQYSQYGYDLPAVVFWNVNAYGNQPVTQHESGVILVSGASPAIYESIMQCDLDTLLQMTPYNMMLRVLNSERYEPVNVSGVKIDYSRR